MNNSDEKLLAALLREDFYTFLRKCFITLHAGTEFVDGWHLKVLAAELEAAARGENKRLIINMPPRSMKSIASSVAMVAWYLGHHANREVICASYGQDLSGKLAQDCRSIMQTAWYQAIFPTRISSSKSSATDFRTVQGGGRLATSVGGPMTGRGADLVVIDDPAKPDEMMSQGQREKVENWFHSTVYSRLNSKRDAGIVLTMQRLHVMDLSGTLLQAGGWKHLRLAAIADTDEAYMIKTLKGGSRTYTRKAGNLLQPERESAALLETIKSTLGSYFFSAQYQQLPMMPDGNLVNIRWFVRYDEAPTHFECVFQSWDTASKTGELNSYSVCTTWGIVKKHIYLLDVLRKRLDYPDLKHAVKQKYEEFKPRYVLVEDKSSGQALIQELWREGLVGLKAIKPEGTKEMRLAAQTSLMEGGMIHLPRAAQWLQDYENELMLFPMGAHADQVDSTSQALKWAKETGGEPGLLRYYRQRADERGSATGGSRPTVWP